MQKDKIYSKKLDSVEKFQFSAEVAEVFEDMLARSVPNYHEVIDLEAQLIHKFYKAGTNIYDLGCSHGNLTLKLLHKYSEQIEKIIAVDQSSSMLDKLKLRLGKYQSQVELLNQDILDLNFKNTSAITLNLTLQFIPANQRESLLKNIYEALLPDGLFLLFEKIENSDKILSQIETDFYYGFKRRNNYSELEISQKREALDQVLVPDSLEAHQERLKSVGFKKQMLFFKYFNFVAIAAWK